MNNTKTTKTPGMKGFILPALGDAAKKAHLVAIFCFSIAAFLHLLGSPNHFYQTLVISLSIGFSCHFLTTIVRHGLAGHSRAIKVAGIVLINLAACVIGSYLGLLFAGMVHLSPGIFSAPFVQLVILGLFFSVIASVYFMTREQRDMATAKAKEEEIKRLDNEKRLVEAQLRTLQAQIEPHFLFNTLANIHGLIETNPASSSEMLENLIRFLRVSLKRSRNERIALSEEMELLKSYLEILKIRMGDRLEYSIEMSEDLGGKQFPPMLLQPLVENSIKHGLEPKLEGGEVRIHAWQSNGDLTIEIRDTGAGLGTDQSGGVGLDNVRSRLNALFGPRGGLTLEETESKGVLATVRTPIEESAP